MSEKTENGNGERTPAQWVNFVSDPEYAGEDTGLRTFVTEPRDFEGVVEYVGKGEFRVGKTKFDSKLIVISNGEKKYGFNLPAGSWYYMYLSDGRDVRRGDRIKVSYLGTADKLGIKGLPRDSAHIISLVRLPDA